jgi:hypothetical protein
MIKIEDLINREYIKRDDDPQKKVELLHYISWIIINPINFIIFFISNKFDSIKKNFFFQNYFKPIFLKNILYKRIN